MVNLKNYPGSKGGSGVSERIVSLMPTHETYVELCVGGGAVFLKKTAAASSILVDIDPEVCLSWTETDGDPVVVCTDATRPEMWPPSLSTALQSPTTLVYVDPPYPRSTRTRRLYRHELESDEDHRRLLAVLRSLPCMVMVSSYYSDLYLHEIGFWRSVAFGAGTRGGRRVEHVWMNFPDGLTLHDSRFVGVNRRDRERIRRKRERWTRKFEAMRPDERQVVLEALQAVS